MKPVAYIPFLVAIVFAGWNWTQTLTTPVPSLAQAVDSQSGDAKIIQKQGDRVRLRRKNAKTKRYENLVIDGKTILNLGDLLIVDQGQTAVIQCENDKTTWTVPDDGLPWGVANVCVPRSPKKINPA